MPHSSSEPRWDVLAGQAVQKVIGTVCAAGVPPDRYRRQLLVLATARDLVVDLDLTTVRRQVFLAEVSTYAGAYLHRFLPSPC
jgi:hypothetical protein